ncbi:MAG: hypothetical protein J6B77_06725 [Clostridia bacterium]|nr:hypothetical protein [Clostridia bacterium]
MKFRKSEDIFHLIGESDARYLADAKKKPNCRLPVWSTAIAAMLVVVLIVSSMLTGGFGLFPSGTPGETTGTPFTSGGVLGNETTGDPFVTTAEILEILTRPDPEDTREPYIPPSPSLLANFAVTSVEYPSRHPYAGYGMDNVATLRPLWIEEQQRLKADVAALKATPDDFFTRLCKAMLESAEQENAVLSPMNVYMALAMVAEVTDGSSRQEILDLLGEDSIESLRATASVLWNSHYRDDGMSIIKLAASLWLRDDLNYKTEALEKIASLYCASSYKGKMGSSEYNDALRAWLNEQTGGTLQDQIQDVSMDEETVLGMATTVYLCLKWENEFWEPNTSESVFYGANGAMYADFMNNVYRDYYYDGSGFSAVRLPFAESGYMSILLPDENVEVSSLFSNAEAQALISSPNDVWKQTKMHEITLSLPKFDVSHDMDLIEGMKSLGVHAIFDPTASDFTPLTDLDRLFVDKMSHGARVAIDEEGCTASAFTFVKLESEGVPQYPPVTFTVDRPFLFVVTSDTGLPLFVGVVNTIY